MALLDNFLNNSLPAWKQKRFPAAFWPRWSYTLNIFPFFAGPHRNTNDLLYSNWPLFASHACLWTVWRSWRSANLCTTGSSFVSVHFVLIWVLYVVSSRWDFPIRGSLPLWWCTWLQMGRGLENSVAGPSPSSCLIPPARTTLWVRLHPCWLSLSAWVSPTVKIAKCKTAMNKDARGLFWRRPVSARRHTQPVVQPEPANGQRDPWPLTAFFHHRLRHPALLLPLCGNRRSGPADLLPLQHLRPDRVRTRGWAFPHLPT